MNLRCQRLGPACHVLPQGWSWVQVFPSFQKVPGQGPKVGWWEPEEGVQAVPEASKARQAGPVGWTVWTPRKRFLS